jgi:hypothetical protein
MKTFFAALVVVASFANSANANQLVNSASSFCFSARKFNNELNMSVAPGTYAAKMIAQKAGQTNQTYSQLWYIAKSLNISACNTMW